MWSGQIVTFKAHGKGEYRYNTGAYWKGECKAGKRQVCVEEETGFKFQSSSPLYPSLQRHDVQQLSQNPVLSCLRIQWLQPPNFYFLFEISGLVLLCWCLESLTQFLQGLGEFINDDGARIEGFWRENMLNGKITIKFADGSVMKSVNFNDDKAAAEHVFADDRQ